MHNKYEAGGSRVYQHRGIVRVEERRCSMRVSLYLLP